MTSLMPCSSKWVGNELTDRQLERAQDEACSQGAGCSTREATPLKLWVSSSSAHARHNLRLHLRLGNFEEVRR